MRTVGWATSICVAIALTGCASFSGLDASSQFSCKAPDGVLCQSMSGVYANAEAHNLPGQRATREAGSTGSQAATAAPAVVSAGGVLTKPIYSGTPIRTAPVVLRVWLAPWEDNDGDLHDQSYIYVPVDGGRWLIEHNRRRIQDAYRPIRAPAVGATPVPTPATARASSDAEPRVVDTGAPAIPQSAADVLNGLLRPATPAEPPSLN